MKQDSYTGKYIIFQKISTAKIHSFPITFALLVWVGTVTLGLVGLMAENVTLWGIAIFLFVLGTIIFVLGCYQERLVIDTLNQMVEYRKRGVFSRIFWCRAFNDIKEIYLQGYNARFTDESGVHYVKEWRVICKLTNNQNLTIYDTATVLFLGLHRTGETEAGNVAKDLAQLIGREVVKKDYVRV